MHAARVLSLAGSVKGVLQRAALGVTVIGKAMAQAKGILPRSGVKQVDRLLSNANAGRMCPSARAHPFRLAEVA